MKDTPKKGSPAARAVVVRCDAETAAFKSRYNAKQNSLDAPIYYINGKNNFFNKRLFTETSQRDQYLTQLILKEHAEQGYKEIMFPKLPPQWQRHWSEDYKDVFMVGPVTKEDNLIRLVAFKISVTQQRNAVAFLPWIALVDYDRTVEIFDRFEPEYSSNVGSINKVTLNQEYEFEYQNGTEPVYSTTNGSTDESQTIDQIKKVMRLNPLPPAPPPAAPKKAPPKAKKSGIWYESLVKEGENPVGDEESEGTERSPFQVSSLVLIDQKSAFAAGQQNSFGQKFNNLMKSAGDVVSLVSPQKCATEEETAPLPPGWERIVVKSNDGYTVLLIGDAIDTTSDGYATAKKCAILMHLTEIRSENIVAFPYASYTNHAKFCDDVRFKNNDLMQVLDTAQTISPADTTSRLHIEVVPPLTNNRVVFTKEDTENYNKWKEACFPSKLPPLSKQDALAVFATPDMHLPGQGLTLAEKQQAKETLNIKNDGEDLTAIKFLDIVLDNHELVMSRPVKEGGGSSS